MTKEANQKWRDKKLVEDPNYRKKELLVKRYGITHEDYDRMAQEQHGFCPSCMNHFGYQLGAMDVDHNHKTGEVRCLMCRNCNITEGKAIALWPFLEDQIWDHINGALAFLKSI